MCTCLRDASTCVSGSLALPTQLKLQDLHPAWPESSDTKQGRPAFLSQSSGILRLCVLVVRSELQEGGRVQGEEDSRGQSSHHGFTP